MKTKIITPVLLAVGAMAYYSLFDSSSNEDRSSIEIIEIVKYTPEMGGNIVVYPSILPPVIYHTPVVIDGPIPDEEDSGSSDGEG